MVGTLFPAYLNNNKTEIDNAFIEADRKIQVVIQCVFAADTFVGNNPTSCNIRNYICWPSANATHQDNINNLLTNTNRK